MERNHSQILAMQIRAQAVCTRTHRAHRKRRNQKVKYPSIPAFVLGIQMKERSAAEAYLLKLRNQSRVHVALSIHAVSRREGGRGGEGWRYKG